MPNRQGVCYRGGSPLETIPMDGHHSRDGNLVGNADSLDGRRDISFRLEWKQVLQHKLDVYH